MSKKDQAIKSDDYGIVFGKNCHLRIELEHRAFCAFKFLKFDFELARKNKLMQLNKLAELRLVDYENAKMYKEKTKR